MFCLSKWTTSIDNTYEESVQTSWNNRNSIEYTMFKY